MMETDTTMYSKMCKLSIHLFVLVAVPLSVSYYNVADKWRRLVRYFSRQSDGKGMLTATVQGCNVEKNLSLFRDGVAP